MSAIDEAWAHVDLAQTELLTRGFGKAERALELAGAIFGEAGLVRELAVVTHLTAVTKMRQGRFDIARLMLAEAGTAFSGLHDAVGAANVRQAEGELCRLLGDIDGALKGFHDSLRLHSETQNWIGVAGSAKELTEIHVDLRKVPEARQYLSLLEEVVDVDSFQYFDVLVLRTTVAFITPGQPNLKDLCAQALEHPRADSEHHGSARLEEMLASAARLDGDRDTALQALARGISRFEALGMIDDVLRCTIARAMLLVECELFQEAVDAATLVMDHLTARSDPRLVGLYFVRGFAYLQLGDMSAARAEYYAAVEVARPYGRTKLGSTLRTAGKGLSEMGLLVEAAHLKTQAVAYLLEDGDTNLLAGIYASAAEDYMHGNQPQRAREVAASAAALYLGVNYSDQAAEMFLEMSIASADLDDWNASRTHAESALRLVTSRHDLIAGRSLLRISRAARHQGDLEVAIAAVGEAITILGDANDKAHADALATYADLLEHAGELNAAEEAAARALEIASGLGLATAAGNAHFVMANIAHTRGDEGLELDHLSAARTYFVESDRRGHAYVIHRLARTRYFKEPSLVEMELVAASEFAAIGHKHGEADALRSIAEFLVLSEPGESEELFHEALQLNREAGNLPGIANCLRGIGKIAGMNEDFGSAEIALTEAHDVARRAGVPGVLCDVEMDLSALALERNDVDRAVQHLVAALDNALVSKDSRRVSLTGIFLSGAMRRSNQTASAAAVYQQVLEVVRDLGRLLLDPHSEEMLRLQRSYLCHAALSFAFDEGLPKLAREFMGLSEPSLIQALSSYSESLDEHDPSRVRLQALAKELAELDSADLPSSDRAEMDTWAVMRSDRREIVFDEIVGIVGDDVHRGYDTAEGSFERNMATLLDRQVVVLQACVSSILPTVPVDGCVLDLVWSIRGSDPVHHRVALKSTHLATLELFASLQKRDSAENATDVYALVDSDARSAFGELCQLLMPDRLTMALLALDRPRLLISPDSLLWNLPWAGLHVGFGEAVITGMRLVDIADISLTPSIGSMRAVDEPVAGRPVLAWFSGVEGGMTELRGLQAGFGDSVVVAESGAELMRALGEEEAETLVLSAHAPAGVGFARGFDLGLGVQFTGSHLFAYRVPKSVVLGACWSASAMADAQVGLLSFADVAVALGVDSLVGGVFPLPDEAEGCTESPTAMLLAHFYEGMAEAPAAVALAAAQRELRSLPAHTWAGVVHYAGALPSGVDPAIGVEEDGG